MDYPAEDHEHEYSANGISISDPCSNGHEGALMLCDCCGHIYCGFCANEKSEPNKGKFYCPRCGK